MLSLNGTVHANEDSLHLRPSSPPFSVPFKCSPQLEFQRVHPYTQSTFLLCTITLRSRLVASPRQLDTEDEKYW